MHNRYSPKPDGQSAKATMMYQSIAFGRSQQGVARFRLLHAKPPKEFAKAGRLILLRIPRW